MNKFSALIAIFPSLFVAGNISAQTVLPACQVNATCLTFNTPAIQYPDGSISTTAALGSSGGAVNLTGPVTSVGAATSIPGPVPQSAVNLSTVTTALATKAASGSNSDITSLSGLSFITGAFSTNGSSITSNGSINLVSGSSLTVPAGTGGAVGMVGGTLFNNDFSDIVATTTNGTAEMSFSTYSVPGNTLTRKNDCLQVECFVFGSASTSTKTYRIRWGGLSGGIVTLQSGAGASMSGQNYGRICRTGDGNQYIGGVNGNGSGSVKATLDLTQPHDVVCTVQTTSAALGDISFGLMKVLSQPSR